ncbi:hypothetical protein F1737_08795 [Methanoplanus sp. FWC-SCC4]|uniref:Uncharacterized protein n=1 Tax=Methanochimaera problematica TaxID=2609417 RepID=A0AA97FC65_9EURY|nr:hypothetical protein [Methanoplanus sp. FWC-SCC4]WOF16780.1 hypothetical protein F1737_08795 [Methanoplanus sp. FWC-SCC4]
MTASKKSTDTAGNRTGKTTGKATGNNKKSSKRYPLYLIARAISEEIHTKGDSIEAITVTRTAGHTYKVETEFRETPGAAGGNRNE